MSQLEEIKGFQIVPVNLPQSKYLKNKNVKHFMYIKKHQSNTDKELSERSLFLINPPINCNLQNIRKFINTISPNSIVENFFLNNEGLDYEINLTKLTSDLYENDRDDDQVLKLPNGTGLVVFVDKSAVNLAINRLKKYTRGKELYTWENIETPASIRFVNAYKSEILPIETTSESVAKELEEFEQREQESVNQLKEMNDVVDEEGFTLVVGKNRKTKRGILGKIDGVTKFKTEQTDNKMKKKEKQDFYRFQLREKKKIEMNELLQKFKHDQERIKELKEKKRFRPY